MDKEIEKFFDSILEEGIASDIVKSSSKLLLEPTSPEVQKTPEAKELAKADIKNAVKEITPPTLVSPSEENTTNSDGNILENPISNPISSEGKEPKEEPQKQKEKSEEFHKPENKASHNKPAAKDTENNHKKKAKK